MTPDVDDTSEFVDITPTRVDAVGTPANGIGFLLLKAADPAALVKSFVDGLCGVSGCEVCHERYIALKETPGFVEKARLDAKERRAVPTDEFAFPKERKEPLNDEGHVRAAIGRFDEVQGVTSAERQEAARRIIARAKHFGIDISEDSIVAHAAKQIAPDRTLPKEEALSQTREVEEPEPTGPAPQAQPQGDAKHVAFPHGPSGDGQGDTAPDKELHRSEAESQTHEDPATKAEGDGTGTHLPDGEQSTEEEEGQTRDLEKASAENTPGSSAWEHKDVALGEKAEALTHELAQVVHTFTEREKAEGGASKSTRRRLSRVRKLLETPALLKEMATVSTSAADVLKMLDEADNARRAEKKAEKKAENGQKKAFEKAVKKEAAKLAKKASADGTAAEDAEASKAAKEVGKLSKKELRGQLEELQGTVAKMAEQDGKRIPTSAAGVTPFMRATPEQRASVLKAFDDRIDAARESLTKAENPMAAERARQDLKAALRQRALAKAVAQENGRVRGDIPQSRLGPNWSSVIKEGSSYTIGEDTSLQYR